MVHIYCHPVYAVSFLWGFGFIQWKTAVWALVSLPSNQEHLHFLHPLSVWRKMQLPVPLTLGRVARSLPADYSYFHKLFLCVSALGSGSMSFWSLRHNSSFAGPGSMLLLDVSTVICQDQTTVGVSWNFSAIPKEPLHESFKNPLLTRYRPTQATEEQSAHLKRQLLITGGLYTPDMDGALKTKPTYYWRRWWFCFRA